MKSDKELKELAEPIVEIYNNIEHDLLLKIASFFVSNEEIVVKNSLDWYFSKLQEMGTLNKETIKILSNYTNKSEEDIEKTLKEAGYGSIDEDKLELLNNNNLSSITWDKLVSSDIINSAINRSYIDTKEVFKMINTSALESTKKAYMNALNQARLEITTGIYDYNTAITRAIIKMVDNGITGATYQRKDGSIYSMSLESVVRRDMITAIYQSFNTGSEAISKEIGAEYYEVSSHLGARLGDGKNPISNHFEWQGKIYKINGSDDKYENFYEKTGYGDILGLGGVNCRHKFWAFFPGIDEPSQVQYDYMDNKKQVELQNKQRAYERKLRKIRTKKDIFKQINDEENYKDQSKKEKELFKEYTEFIDKNNLHRDYARERIVKRNIQDKRAIRIINHAKVTTSQHFKDTADKQLRKHIIKETRNLYNKYSDILPSDKISWRIGDLETTDEGMALADDRFVINYRVVDSEKKFIKIVSANQKSGFLAKTDNKVGGIVAHEVGHRIQIHLYRKLFNRPNALREEAENWVKTFMRSVIDEYEKKYPNETKFIFEALSEYGGDKEYEMFSEAFAEYNYSKNPRPFARTFGIMFEEERKKIK